MANQIRTGITGTTLHADDKERAAMNLRYQMLDPLRGLAALWVFLFHFRFSASFQSEVPWLHTLLKFGDRGVPIFFVISGYCLSASAASAMRRSESSPRFMMRRALRIYPTFWYSIVFIVVSHMLFVAAWEATDQQLPRILANRFAKYDWFDWLKIVSLTQIFDRNFGIWFGRFGAINGAYWTLAIELQFYAVVAIGLLRPRLYYPVIAAVTLVSIPCYFSQSLFRSTTSYGLFFPYWTWFALGVLLFELFRHNLTPRRAFGQRSEPATLALLTLLTAGTVACIYGGILKDRLLFAAIFTVWLWLAQPWNEKWVERLSDVARPGRLSRGLTLLGAMSYSLYLVHNQISQMLVLAGRRVMHAGIGLDVIVVVATCALCYPFYLLCEAPIIRLAAGQRRKSRSTEAMQSAPDKAHDATANRPQPHPQARLQARRRAA